MPRFGERSRTNLEQAHPDLQRLFNRVIELYDCSVICGFRGEAAQTAALHAGTSTKAFPESKHNQSPSLAVDVVPWWKERPHIRWNGLDAERRMYYFGGLVKGLAAEMGIAIRWGGNWDGDDDLHDQTFFDLPHFELAERP